MMRRKKDIFLIYAIYIAIFRPYFLPDAIRQIIKLILVIIVFAYLVLHTKRKKWLNISMLYGGCIIVSSYIAYKANIISRSTLFNGLYYSICLYTVYLLISYFAIRRRSKELIKGLLDMSSIYVALTMISLIHPLYIDDSGLVTYLFGNKFSSSYYFFFLIATYYSLYNERIHKDAAYKLIYFLLITLSILFSFITACSTTIISSAMFFVLYFLNEKIRKLLMRPLSVGIGIGISAAFPVMMTAIVSNKYVQYLITNILGESLTLNYRNVIYNNHLFYLISNRLLFGYGYNNTAMLDRTNQVFSNAQNGLMDIVLRYGVIGAAALVLMMIVLYKRSSKTEKVEGYSFLVHILLIAGMIEITYNWFMLWAVFLVGWIDFEENNIKRKRKRRRNQKVTLIKRLQ